MKAIVDQEKCIGCGLCVEVCPGVFEMHTDKAKTHVTIVPAGLEDECKSAADQCPVEAITVQIT